MAKRPTSRSKPADAPAPAEQRPKRVRRSAAPARSGSSPKPAAAEPTVDDIRRRAYERYLERGGNHGRHFDDWLEAEKELRPKK